MPKEIQYAECGARLSELQKNASLTRQELGDICGIAQSTIVNSEKGLRMGQ